MKLYVTKRAEPDHRLEFKKLPPHWLSLAVIVVGAAAAIYLYGTLLFDGR